MFIFLFVYSYHVTHSSCAMQSNAYIVNDCVWCAILFSIRCACLYTVCSNQSQINQYRANNQIVYIINLSGMIQQVHLCALYPSHHYRYQLRLSLLFHVYWIRTEIFSILCFLSLSLFVCVCVSRFSISIYPHYSF